MCVCVYNIYIIHIYIIHIFTHMYVFNKTHQTVQLKRVKFITSKLHINKEDF